MIKYFLIHICGFDPIILQKEEIEDLTFKRFAYSFLFVILLTLFASYVVFINTIESITLSILLSFFFTLLIINLYRLIIVTSSPNNLLIQKDNFKDLVGHFIVKFVLLMMIFFIIAKPTETVIFNKDIEYILDDYRSTQINNYRLSLSKNSEKVIEGLWEDYNRKFNYRLENNLSNKNDSLTRVNLKNQIKLIEVNDSEKVDLFETKIYRSKLFFQQIIILNKDIPKSFITSLLFLILVFYPIYLIMYDVNFRKYFEEEQQSNNHLIKMYWRRYSKEQEERFYKKTGKKLVRQNLYQDPPFNRLKSIDKTKYLKKGSLIEWFKNNY